MEINEFWNLIDRVKTSGGFDIEERSEVLGKELQKLKPSEIVSFSKVFSALLDKAYTRDLWGAAYTIQGGCGDDSFWDFRSALISTGKEVFELAVSDPDTLSELEENEVDNLYFEGFQYIASQVYEDLTENELPGRDHPHPTEPFGEDWDFDDEENIKSKLPRLYRKYVERG